MYVGLGFYDLRVTTETQIIKGKFHAHPGFDTSTYDNDISLIELETEAKLNNHVQTIPLAKAGSDIAAGTQLLANGWGSTTCKQINVHGVSKHMPICTFVWYMILKL